MSADDQGSPGPSVAPMNRCARIVGPYQCGRLSCHTGACEFRDHTGHVVEAAPSSGVARDRARAFIEAEAITSEAYGADIIVVGRTFEDALVALLETETQVSRDAVQQSDASSSAGQGAGLDNGTHTKRAEGTPE